MSQTAIAGVGIDLVAVARVARLTSRNEEIFRLRVLGSREREEISSDADVWERHCAYACSIAAKEAFLKALGTGLDKHDRWTDIELVDRKSMGPQLAIAGAAKQRLAELNSSAVHVSVALLDAHAMATVVLERCA